MYCSRFHSSIYFFDFLVKQIFGNQDIPIFSSPWSDLVTCLGVDFSNFRTKKMSIEHGLSNKALKKIGFKIVNQITNSLFNLLISCPTNLHAFLL